VWLPVRNGATTLARAVDSIRRQTFKDWRLILVDDGSTDGTPGIAARLEERDDRIRVIRQPALGLVAALKTAAARSDAPFAARMDADDLAHPHRIEAQLAMGGDIRATRVRTIGAGEGMRRYVRWNNSLTTHDEMANALFVESPLVHPTAVFSRVAYERAGGYRDPGWAEDYDLWLRAWRAGLTFAKVPRALLAWRDRPTRLTRTHPAYSEDAMRRAKLEHLPRHPMLARGPITIWGAGPIGRAWVHDLRRLGFTVEQAIDIDPRKIGRKLGNEVPVRSPEDALARRGGPVLGAVGSRGARTLIRRRLVRSGLVEGEDFLFLA
jgi:cellulose synthase/poly-beta-1,6-N-acetylglucosamine synthase-like glycosyltransferase